MWRIQIVSFLIALFLVLIILELVRRRRLREEYALLWLLVGAFMSLLTLWRSLPPKIAKFVGIYYPPAALFLFGLLFIVLLMLHFSIIISKLTEQNKELAQTIALLEERGRERDKKVE